MSEDKEILDMLKTVKNVYQIKFTNGDEILCRVSTYVQRLDEKPVSISIRHLLTTRKVFSITWPMAVKTIRSAQDTAVSEKIDYVFKPWMLLQTDLDNETLITTENVVSLQEPSIHIKMQFFEMVLLYKEFIAVGKQNISPLSSDKLSGVKGNVISIFDKMNVEDTKDSD